MVESLAHYNQEITTAIPISIAFIGWLWRKLKDERSQQEGIPPEALEIHHKKPVYKGGKDKPGNLVAVTRPEHALEHRKLADQARNRRDRQLNRQAEQTIVSRMTKQEYSDYVRRTRK